MNEEILDTYECVINEVDGYVLKEPYKSTWYLKDVVDEWGNEYRSWVDDSETCEIDAHDILELSSEVDENELDRLRRKLRWFKDGYFNLRDREFWEKHLHEPFIINVEISTKDPRDIAQRMLNCSHRSTDDLEVIDELIEIAEEKGVQIQFTRKDPPKGSKKTLDMKSASALRKHGIDIRY